MLQQQSTTQDVPALIYQPGQQESAAETQATLQNLSVQDYIAETTAEAKLEANVLRNVRTIERCRRVQVIVNLLGVGYLGGAFWHNFTDHTPYDRVFSIVTLAYFVLAFGSRKVSANAAKRLAEIETVQAIPPLLDAIVLSGYRNTSPAYLPLLRLIPRLRAADYNLIDERRRKILLRTLGRRFNRIYKWLSGLDELKLAILKALEQVGDENAIPVVEKLAAESRNVEVRNAAIECLPFLRQKSAQVTPGRTLLRAAAEPQSEATLLRAAAANASPPPIELLRPTTHIPPA